MSRKLEALYFLCVAVMVFGILPGAIVLVLAGPPVVTLRNPPTHINVALYGTDYLVLAQAFREAVKSKGIQDGATEGLMVVRLRTEDARRLMLTILVAQQGSMTKAEKVKFMKAQEEYYRNLSSFHGGVH